MMGQRAGLSYGGARAFGAGSLLVSGLMLLILLAILGCVIYLVVVTAKNSKKHIPVNNGQNNTPEDSLQSLKILDERFARGEITEDEYKTKKELILKR